MPRCPGGGGRAWRAAGPAWTSATSPCSRRARALVHVDAEPEAWKQGLANAGVPAEYAELLGQLFVLIRTGGDAHLSDGVQRALGRPARSFSDWAAAEATELKVPATA